MRTPVRNVRVLVALALATLTTGCSSIRLNHDWDRDAPFSSYQTFAWIEQRPAAADGNARTALVQNDLLHKRIQSAVTEELEAHGLRPDPDNPDLRVVYHTGIEDKINVTDWGYSYSYDYWGYGGRDIDVYQYEEGTLVVDLIDSETTELVWRGWATGTVDRSASPEKRDYRIAEAVHKIMSRYPPPAK